MIRAVHDFAFADVALDPSANAARDASVEDVVSLEHVDHLREDGVKRVDRRVLETPVATLRPAPARSRSGSTFRATGRPRPRHDASSRAPLERDFVETGRRHAANTRGLAPPADGTRRAETAMTACGGDGTPA